VTLAGLKKLRAEGKIGPSETVVLVLTGHTLKDADYTIDFHRGTLLNEAESAGHEAEIAALQRNAQVVEATPAGVLAALKGRG
jgi:threonine synthase